MNDKIIVLIPAYEPTTDMIKLLEELKKKKLKSIVVDDGSGNNYSDIFKKAQKLSTVLIHEENRGKGAALKTGYKYISENYGEDYVIVTVDCDGQHRIDDAIKICEYALKHDNTLVIGKRLRGEKTPLRSYLGNAITRFVYRITTGIDVYDTQSGLRAFSYKLLPFMLKVDGERFEYEMNVLLECPKNKIKIKEITIETIYIDNNSGSHFSTVKDSARIYKKIFSHWFRKK